MKTELCEGMPLSQTKEKRSNDVIMLSGEEPLECRNRTLQNVQHLNDNTGHDSPGAHPQSDVQLDTSQLLRQQNAEFHQSQMAVY